ncbi:hypothetical protein JD844_012609, partial [Phrynosoma platyrhinos]
SEITFGLPFQILINMFLILLATTELKDFFAKARNGSIRLIKIVIEDGLPLMIESPVFRKQSENDLMYIKSITG